MQPILSKEQLWEKIDLLNTFQQQTVVALVEKLLNDAPPSREANGFHRIETDEREDDPDLALAKVVARIKATPPNPDAIERGAKVGDTAYIQHLLDNPPTDTLTVAEWEEYWPAFEQELKELDRAQDIAEGRF